MNSKTTQKSSDSNQKKLLVQSIILNVLAVVLIAIGTVFVIFYAKGYRFNLYNSTIERTGVLNVESTPTRADFFLNEDVKGKTPKTVASIKEGDYELQVWKEGYHTFKYKVSIKIEKSTPVFAFLFREIPIGKLVQALQNDVVTVVENSSRSQFFILEKITDTGKIATYKIISFKGDTNFWETNNTTQDVLTFTLGSKQIISNINVSPDSKYILMDITGDKPADQQTALAQGTQLISIDLNKIIKTFNIKDVQLQWSNDSQSIVYTQQNQVFTIDLKTNLEPQVVYTPQKGNQIITTNTDSKGSIYTIEETIGSTGKFVILNQITQPNRIVTLIDKIYYQTDEKYIKDYKELTEIPYTEFSNAPQSTLLVGKPSTLLISPESQSIFFTTDIASYRYNTQTGKYALILPFKTDFFSISPDKKKILMLNKENETLAVTIFDKEVNSHFITLGTKTIGQYPSATCTDIGWVGDSTELLYICNKTMYVLDIDGINNIALVGLTGDQFLINSASNKVYTLIPSQLLNDGITNKTITENQIQTYSDLIKDQETSKQLLVEFEIH